MQEDLLVCICVGSFINWESPFEQVSENNFDPSVVSMSLDHHEEDLALKSLVITDEMVYARLCRLKVSRN